MLKRLFSTGVLLLSVAGCGDKAATIEPTFDFRWPGSYVTRAAVAGTTQVLGVRQDATLVNYAARASKSAVAYRDTTACTDAALCAPTAQRVTPTTVAAGAAARTGAAVFAFDRVLDGYSIETPQYRKDPVTGEPIGIGQDDFLNAFKIVTGYIPKAGIIAYHVAPVAATPPATNEPVLSTGSLAADDFFPEYHPDGGWAVDFNTLASEFPPPAIVVRPNVIIAPLTTRPAVASPVVQTNFQFPLNSVIIIHLMADIVKDTEGKLVPAAVNSAGEKITVRIGGVERPVAATIVLRTST